MAPYVSYIQDRLSKQYPVLERVQGGKKVRGVDLNRNKQIDPKERLRLNKQGKADADAWRALLKQNRAVIRRGDPFFRWGAGLKPDNPIHEILHQESRKVSKAKIQQAYQFIVALKQQVKKELEEFSPTPAKLTIVHDILRKKGIKFSNKIMGSLSEGLIAKKLNGSKSNYLILAVGHELGWPVKGTTVPLRRKGMMLPHFIVRWIDKDYGIRLNSDQGRIVPDVEYQLKSSVDVAFYMSPAKGGLFGSFDLGKIKGILSVADGALKILSGDYGSAVSDFKRAIGMNPKMPAISMLNGIAQFKRGRYIAAHRSLETAMSRMPGSSVTKMYLNIMKAIPLRFDLNVQTRMTAVKSPQLDYGFQIALQWFLFGTDAVPMGPRLTMGYGGTPQYDQSSVAAGLGFLYQTDKMSLLLGVDIGYNGKTRGDESQAPLKTGPFLKGGAQLSYRATDYFSIGVSLEAYYNLLLRENVVVSPGILFSFIPDFSGLFLSKQAVMQKFK